MHYKQACRLKPIYLVSPLQQFVKTHLRDFKNFRKQHEKAMEKYENQLAKYSGLGKSKEPSAIREEAFRLHEARKEYVRMSGQHVLRVLNFRSTLEHCLVERFTAATVAHKDFYKDIQVWANLDAALSYWKQWLIDLHRQQIARKKLQEEFIKLTAPDRDIGKYVVPLQAEKSDGSMINSKWGYLFVRVSRHSWARKWFFIHDGYFGVCQVNSSGKQKGSIAIEAKIRLADCQVQAVTDVDRRFCFEVIQPKQQASFLLQAETEEIRLDWLRVFTEQQQENKLTSSPMSLTKYPALSRSKAHATTALSSPTATTSTDISHSNASSPKMKHTDSSSTFSNISVISHSNQKQPLLNDSSLTLSKGYSGEGPSIVMVSTTPDTEATLANSSSLTPLLVWEAARGAPSSITTTATRQFPAGSWGIPWSLVPTMMDLTQDFNVLDSNATKAPSSTSLPRIVWPAEPASVDISDVDIQGYSDKMISQNRELRRLFVFVCCLRKQPDIIHHDAKEAGAAKSKLNSPDTDTYEKELVQQLAQTGLQPPSDFGYAYTGRGFITQTTFWFYSCVLMTCINSVAVRLKDIDQVNVVKDQSLARLVNETALAMNSDLVITITLLSNSRSDIKEPLILGTLLEDVETTAEKLRFAVCNAKKGEPIKNGDMFNKMVSISKNTATHKSVVVDLPLSFKSALSHITNNTGQRNTGTIVSVSPRNLKTGNNRPHASTVGPESKINPASLLISASRQRGESEPTIPVNVPAVMVPSKKMERPMPDRMLESDMPPSNILYPKSFVECNCDDHPERKDSQINLPISAKRCYELLFSDEQTAPPTDGGVWAEKTAAIEGHDLSVSKWSMVDGKMQRILKYWMPVSNPIVRMKEAEVVETQILIHKEDYIRYTVQISTKTAALPYADAFIPSVRYCITWINKSECQLTCYLGVRWVKSVLVRAIVTRAALKGMADSVGIFMPILQKAAEDIKQSVDHARNQVVEYNKNLFQDNGVPNDLNSPSMRGQSTDYVLEVTSPIALNVIKQQDESGYIAPPSTIQPIKPSSTVNLTTISSKAVEKASPSPSVSSTTTALDKGSDFSSNPSSDQQPVLQKVQERQKPHNSRVRSVSPRQSKHDSSQTPKMNEARWYSMVTDYITSNSKTIIVLFLFGYSVYMATIWIQNGYGIADEVNGFVHPNFTCKGDPHIKLEQQPIFLQKSTSRSVYLRDLDEGFLENSIQPPFAKSTSFQVFLQSKSDAAAKEAYALNSRHWYASEHYRLAVDLDMSRDRVAMLRHDMLTAFKMLNKLDTQLVENEFINWLLDTRFKCKYYPPLPEQDPRAEKAIDLCKDIKDQLDKLL
ncbi:hypothetical protein [Parasitella parasitica]|uniref:Uncharacterized protein n=1 Tax=Parasitella parasitica TaxID=35722 RepID=A0A0B7MWX5_9FUNG|nr:hypothetical protein [Parasitella parasitica]